MPPPHKPVKPVNKSVVAPKVVTEVKQLSVPEDFSEKESEQIQDKTSLKNEYLDQFIPLEAADGLVRSRIFLDMIEKELQILLNVPTTAGPLRQTAASEREPIVGDIKNWPPLVKLKKILWSIQLDSKK